MTAPPRFTAAERRARLGVRHRLAAEARAGSVEEVAASLVALHSTDATAVFVAAWMRLADRTCGPQEVERALYEDRTLLRILAMRRTMFVVDRATAPVVHAAASVGVAARERAKLVKAMETSGVGGVRREAWLAKAEAVALEALETRGELTATELAAVDPRLAVEVRVGTGKWTASAKMASRVLLLLGADGRAIRARPRGGWSSTQFRWAAMRAWAGAPLEALDAVDAERALARAWLRSFGPARVEDLKWWTGWTLGQTRRALVGDDVAACVLEDGADGIVLADDLDPVEAPAEWIALLPGLDSTPMGWKHRDFYLGPHAERLFDVNGNVAPTVWHDGRIVGVWAKRPSGEIAFALLEDIGAAARRLLDAEASALAPRLADATLAPRGRGYAPAERELVG
jgi:Winged helix DNA-binding domain